MALWEGITTRMRGSARPADRHPGRYAAALAFARQRSFVLANLGPLGLVLAGALGVATVLWLWMPVGAGVRGLTAGLFLAGVVGAVAHWVSIASGSSMASLGRAAEEWTATELHRMHRHGWRTVNHVMFRTWDVDHIAVGPDGVLVFETKWRSEPIDLTAPDRWIEAAADRLDRSRRDVAGFLRPLSRRDVPISSVLVVWGPGIDQPGDDTIPIRPGVNLLAGRHLRRNLAELGDAHLTSDEIDAIYRKLHAQAALRDRADAEPTLRDAANRWLMRAAAALLGGCVVILALFVGIAALGSR